jgi:SAM-dependent methyltransferase
MSRDDGSTDQSWSSYLDGFHAQQPGITERVLERAHNSAINPYEWAAAGVPSDAVVLDLACGSGPLAKRLTGPWVGIDRSSSELDVANGRGVTRLVNGDGAALPFMSSCFDAVVCSMALMLVQPLDDTIAELHRVLRPRGRLVALLPSSHPLTLRDRLRWGSVLFTLRRARLTYPNADEVAHLAATLAARGLDVDTDESRRFAYSTDSAQAFGELIQSLYLPGTAERRRQKAIAVAEHWAGTEIGIPLRRIVAVRADDV